MYFAIPIQLPGDIDVVKPELLWSSGEAGLGLDRITSRRADM